MSKNDKEEIAKIKNSLIEAVTSFCRKRLDEDYAVLCVKLIEKMARKRVVPFISGRPEIWSAAVVYAIGSINFLFDKSFEPYIPAAEICEDFGVKNSSVTQKAKIIRDMFGLNYYDPDFSTKNMQKNNPFNDMAIVDGFVVPKSMLTKGLFDDIDSEP
jgi:hypothetical protein